MLFAAIFGVVTFVNVLAWTAIGASVERLLSYRRVVGVFNLTVSTVLASLILIFPRSSNTLG